MDLVIPVTDLLAKSDEPSTCRQRLVPRTPHPTTATPDEAFMVISAAGVDAKAVMAEQGAPGADARRSLATVRNLDRVARGAVDLIGPGL